MKSSLSHLDRRLTRSSDSHRSRLGDELFTSASQVADRSLLWVVVAGLLAGVGGRRGRRAAARGLVGIAIASAVVNGPLKLLVHRARPRKRAPLVPTPRTSSFPSGHSASAFAFAVAASRELPPATALLVPLAATVSYSRVYVGVHYPSDVLLGATLGAGAGLLADRLLNVAADREPEAQPSPSHSLPRELVLAVSPHAGRSSGLATARRTIEQLGLSVVHELRIDEISTLADLTHGPNGQPRLVVAAGGDGTVGAGCVSAMRTSTIGFSTCSRSRRSPCTSSRSRRSSCSFGSNASCGACTPCTCRASRSIRSSHWRSPSMAR